MTTVGCTARYQIPLKVGSNNWPGYKPFYYALEKKLISKHELKMIEYGSSTEVVRAFRNGNIQGAALTLDEVILLASEDFHPNVVLVLDESAGADSLLLRKGTELKKGLRVGVEEGALGAYFLSRAADKLGIEVADLKIVNLELSQHEQAFLQNKVDALVTFEPVKSRILSQGGFVVFDSTAIPGEIMDVLIFRDEVLRGQDKKIQAIVNAWLSAVGNFKSDSQFLADHHVTNLLDGILFVGQKENETIMNTQQGPFLEKAQRLAEFMKKKGLIKREVSLKSIVSNKFIINGSGTR